MQLHALGEETGRGLSARGESVGVGVENMDSGPGCSTYLGQVAYPVSSPVQQESLARYVLRFLLTLKIQG